MGYAQAYCAALAVIITGVDMLINPDVLLIDNLDRFIFVGFVMVMISCWLASRHADGYRDTGVESDV